MDRQDLERNPSILETIVSLDWMSPTLVEVQALGISDNLNARICFRPIDGQVWIIDGGQLRIRQWPDQENVATLKYNFVLEGAD